MAMLKEVAKTDAKKRNEGPIVVTFAAGDKTDNKRVPNGVTGVVITDRKGNTKTYSIAQIPTEVQTQLIAMAFAGRVKTYVNNQAKDDSNANIVALSDKIFNDMATGKIYTRAESEGGAARGRVFDPSMYVEAYRLTKDAQHRAKVVNKKTGKIIEPATEVQLKQLGTQLISVKGKDRTEKLKAMMSNAVFQKHYLVLKSKAIKTNEVESIDDLEF